MAAMPPSPETTLAILLGAENSPKWPALDSSPAFEHSARKYEEYLKDAQGLNLPEQNVKNLFNKEGAPGDLTRVIREFLRERQETLGRAGRAATDLLLYHVGHGDFVGEKQAYHLVLRDSDEDDRETTTLAITALASILRDNARSLRKYLILDACFAAAATPTFQSVNGKEIKKQTEAAFLTEAASPSQELPSRGVALLCSSSRERRSKAPAGQKCTMFSEALLEVLTRGVPGATERLTLRAVGEKTVELILAKHKDEAVRPEVHAPDQRHGDIAGKVPLFPNRAPRNSAPRTAASLAPVANEPAVTAASLSDPPTRRPESPATSSPEPVTATASAKTTVPIGVLDRFRHLPDVPADVGAKTTVPIGVFDTLRGLGGVLLEYVFAVIVMVALGGVAFTLWHYFFSRPPDSAPAPSARGVQSVPVLDDRLKYAQDSQTIDKIRAGLVANEWLLDEAQQKYYGRQLLEAEERVKALEKIAAPRRSLAEFLRAKKDGDLGHLIAALEIKDPERSHPELRNRVHSKEVGLLFEALTGDDGQVREGAAEALSALARDRLYVFGQERASLSAPLGRLLLDEKESRTVREAACFFLGQLGQEAEPAAELLFEALKTADAEVRLEAAATLWDMEVATQAQVQAAVAVFRDTLGAADTGLRVRAADRLWQADHTNPQFLVTALGTASEDRRSKDAAQELLRKIEAKTVNAAKKSGPGEIPNVAELIKNVKQGDYLARSQAVRDLSLLGPKAAEAVPTLVRVLEQDEDIGLRGLAADALGSLGLAAPSAASHLRTIMEKEGDDTLRMRAAVALARVDRSQVEPALAVALQVLGRFVEQEKDRQVTGYDPPQLIGGFGADGGPAVPALRKVLSEKSHPLFQLHAIESLGRIGPAAKDAVEDLRPFLRGPRRHTIFIPYLWQEAAAVALGRIGPSAKAALLDLRTTATDDRYAVVREAARRAVEEIERGSTAGGGMP